MYKYLILNNIFIIIQTLGLFVLTPVAGYAASGEEIYKSKCSSCHDSGAGLAPRVNVRADWAEREKRGRAAMMESALKGMPATAMAAKGGYTELTDDDVRATVDYMLTRAGFRDEVVARIDAPAAPTARVTPPIAVAPASVPAGDDATLVNRVAESLAKTLAPGTRIELYAGEAILRGLNIRVGVRDGVVTLSGAVEKSDLIPKAQAITRAVSGVRQVQSRLVAAGMLDFD